MKVIKGARERTTGIGEAKAHFSQLVRDAARGHEWVITERGRPIARLVSIAQKRESLEGRLLRLEKAGVIDPVGEVRVLPPPLPLEAGLAQRFLDEDRG